MSLQERLAQIFFPPKCVLCGKILEKAETDFCISCRLDNPQWEKRNRKIPFVADFAAVWYYENTARESILRYKFRGARGYAKTYGRCLAMALQRQEIEEYDLITWVPTGTLRRLCRGYDQVELLASALGQELGVTPVKLLKKVRNNKPQSGIQGDAQRRANVLGVYRLMQDVSVMDKRILLLDDVITTGATIAEAARVLLTAGAQDVYGGAVAIARRKGK